MTWLVALGLLVVPWLEIWLLAKVGLSAAAATVWCVVTAAVGYWFTRQERLDLWSELESDVANGRVPSEEALDAMAVVLAGWALIVPGLLTDLAGGLVLVPQVRRLLVGSVRSLMRARLL